MSSYDYIYHNADIAQLARAASWSLAGRLFDAICRHWKQHIRNTEKSWFIARGIALMDAYMDAMARGLKSWWLAGNRCTSGTLAASAWRTAFEGLHAGNAGGVRSDIPGTGWCMFPIMVAWQSGRMRRTVNPLVKFINSPQLFKSIRHHFSHDEPWWIHECMSEMHSLCSSCCSMRWRTGHSDSTGSILKPPLAGWIRLGAAEG